MKKKIVMKKQNHFEKSEGNINRDKIKKAAPIIAEQLQRITQTKAFS
jgi:hypothetical protein